MAVVYRKLEEPDLDVFMEMRMAQLQEEGAEADFDLKPYLQDYYIRHLKDNTFVSWLAVDEGKIGLLSSMYVIKEYRRKGIARLLLDKVMKEAKDYGCAAEQITASDMGVLLYTDYGFKKNSNFMYYTF